KNPPDCRAVEYPSDKANAQTDFPDCLRRRSRSTQSRAAEKPRLRRDFCFGQRSRQSSPILHPEIRPLHHWSRRTGGMQGRNVELAEREIPGGQNPGLEFAASAASQ